jgi:hypothetical protein
MELLPR